MPIWSILLAAGRSTRLAASGQAARKQFLVHQGVPLFWHSARRMARIPAINGIVFVFPPDEVDQARAWTQQLQETEDLGAPWLAVAGGGRRQDSVWNGLQAVPAQCRQVLVHDAARPFASATLIATLAESLNAGCGAVIPAVPVTDTIKQVEGNTVRATLERTALMAVQTPQAFDRDLLVRAHLNAQAQGITATDDASLVEALGEPVTVIPGEETNLKITTPEDLRLLAKTDTPSLPRVGFGYDVHRYGSGRPMKLGGLFIPGGPEVIAHSDGDVLLHALTDALLGCLGQGDIGQHFPDTDGIFENMESAVFLNEALQQVWKEDLRIVHVDLTVIAQIPKVSPHREAIRQNVARLLHLDPRQVNVKATTEEGLGFTGEKKGIKAVAVATCLGPCPD